MNNKIAIISDTQGNYSALKQILYEIEYLWGKCIMISLGNMAGIGNKPLKTMEEIQINFQHSFKGNAERILLKEISTPQYGSPRVKIGMDIAQKECKKVLNWLKTLPEYGQVSCLWMQRNSILNQKYIEILNFLEKEIILVENLSKEKFQIFTQHLYKNKMNYLYSGSYPSEIFSSANNNWIRCENNYDFSAEQGGNIVVVPMCGLPFYNGYCIYDIEKNTFHIRYVEIKCHDLV